MNVPPRRDQWAARVRARAPLPAQEAEAEAALSFEDAFRAGFDAMFQSLFRYADRLTGDPALASDVAQEALVRLFRRGAMPDDARAWLVTVVNNQLRTHRRDVRRRNLLLVTRAADVPTSSPPPATDALAESRESRAVVRAALDALAPRDREMLLLRADGYSYREIAAALGLTETSVGTFLGRARAAFLRALKGDFDGLD